MNLKTFFLATLIALGFGGWPIVANYSKATSEWIGMVIFGGGWIVVTTTYWFQGKIDIASFPKGKGMLWLFAATVINGFVLTLYTPKLADHAVPPGPLVVTVAVLMVVWAVILDWGLNGAVPTSRHAIGFAFGAIAIFLLK